LSKNQGEDVTFASQAAQAFWEFGKIKAWPTKKLVKVQRHVHRSAAYYFLLTLWALVFWRMAAPSQSGSLMTMKQIEYVTSMPKKHVRTARRYLVQYSKLGAFDREVVRETRRLGRPRKAYRRRHGRPSYGYQLSTAWFQEDLAEKLSQSTLAERELPGVVSAIKRMLSPKEMHELARERQADLVTLIERTLRLFLAENGDPDMVSPLEESRIDGFLSSQTRIREFPNAFALFPKDWEKKRVSLPKEMINRSKADFPTALREGLSRKRFEKSSETHD